MLPGQWIWGGGGPTVWPAPNPDLIPSDFYFCGHLNSTVCGTAVSDVQDLQRRIQNVCETIRTTPGILQRVRQSLFSDLALKLKVDILQIFCILQEVVTRKPCFRKSMSVKHFLSYIVPSVHLLCVWPRIFFYPVFLGALISYS